MSAQYRPFRDEDNANGLEATAWTDNEPGSIQIYEKTTEELPFGPVNKRQIWVQIALLSAIFFLGFLLGFFSRYHPADGPISAPIEGIDSNSSSKYYNQHVDYREDPTIKDKLLARVDGNYILALLKAYQDTNRMPGSDLDHKFALDIQNHFHEFRFDHVSSTNYTYKTMLPKRATEVKILNSDNKTLYSNVEGESYTNEDVRPFLPLSQANETTIVTNQLIYLNRGTKEDYAKFESLNVNMNGTEGKVFVIRQTFYQAHDIVLYAQDAGATAILLFPDPDLYGSSPIYPSKVQLPNDAGRSHPTAWSNYGDLAYFNSVSGIDVMKLGLGKEARVQIPVIPISYNTAAKILRGLRGAAAPSDWNCFDFTLYLGPGYREENNIDGRDKIKIDFFNEEKTLTSSTITGIITGSSEPDRYVVIGSRRDSLNRGLLDSVSGTAVMLEIARVYSDLLRQDWRPRRTIIFNSFGAESFNLIGSSNWLGNHQKILHSRAVAYLNCDLVVTGNQSISISASPLLYQVLFNATRQVPNPNIADEPKAKTVYDSWKAIRQISKTNEIDSNKLTDSELEKILEEFDRLEPRLLKSDKDENPEDEDKLDDFGQPGSILHEYRKSATVRTRPKTRRLDLRSIYSPFLVYGGIPVADVRYSGFKGSERTNLIEDMLPLIGTKYDNYMAIQHIDPHLKYHVTVAQVLIEMLRDLSDSTFLPFNLLDYAITLKESYGHFDRQHGKMFNDTNVDIGLLKEVIQEFTKAAIRFHHRQDMVDPRDTLKVRQINDQLMFLERAFLDPNGTPNFWEKKHIVLSPNDGQESNQGFPGLIDWITLLENESFDPADLTILVEILKVHYKSVVNTIYNAIKIIDEVHII